MDMDQLLSQLASMMKQREQQPDLLKDEPGYTNFIKASNYEYEVKNYKKAKEFYEKACEAGHPLAQVNYALWYLEGNRPGVRKDFQKAYKLFEKAAEKKLGMALFNLADFYFQGKGDVVEVNFPKAFKLAKEAIKDIRLQQMKQPGAYLLLGRMYCEGKGTFKSYAKSKAMYEKAKEIDSRCIDENVVRYLKVLEQIGGADDQTESDRRWDQMCEYIDKHPEEKCKTMGDHLAMLNKFGFKLEEKILTPEELAIEGEFDKFIEVTGGGSTSMMETYEMQNARKPVIKCECCGKAGAKKRCSRCGEYYCSRECQKNDWKDHKKVCQIVEDNIHL